VNGVFKATDPEDAIATALERDQGATLASLPQSLAGLPRAEVPLRPYDMVGLPALRALLASETAQPAPEAAASTATPRVDRMGRLVDDLERSGRGLIMIMGKGGVGKTTIAAIIAVGLAKRGHSVHLTTTDPAAHVSFVVEGSMPGLTVDRIDPEAETTRYIDKIVSTKGRDLDEQGKALLLEDLASPCTEEVAVFHAFSRTVAEARSAFVVMDTAPTGHTLLLLDATGAYHRQMTRHLAVETLGSVTTPLMRLQNPDYTKIILVTLPEITPVSEASALQDDLRRAGIEPYAWVVNRSMAASGTQDPVLVSRITGEARQIDRIRDGLAKKVFLVPFAADPLIGIMRLKSLS
jgi:arsenite-transporting ATPase